MAEFFRMPAISPTMEMGSIVAWRVAEGEAFVPQTVIAEVGTDKANMDAEVFDAGVMIKHLVAEGAEVKPGFPIAIVGQNADEDVSGLLEQFEVEKSKSNTPEPVEQPTESPAPTTADVRKDAAPSPAAAGVTVERTWMGATLSGDFMDPPGDLGFAPSAGGRVKASPLARRVARQLHVPLDTIQGSGPRGRVVKADVVAASRHGAVAVSVSDESITNSPMRRTIARRLLQSHQDIPTFFLTVTFDMDPMVSLRTQLKSGGVKVSYNDLLIAAVAKALRQSPKVNAAWGADTITRLGRIDIGVAVAVEDGLMTPVVRGADALTPSQIGNSVRELAGRAKEGKLSPEEYTGSTFTISNLGMFDIDQFTAIINPPEAAILAIGTIKQVPVARQGSLTIGHQMKVTMTCDHRVIDGATGAEFLQKLTNLIESPALLLV